MMENVKSQIFIFDLIFSVVIIIVSLGIVGSYFVNTNYNVDIYDLNNQILNGFTQTKINSLNSLEIRKMFINNQIKNIDNTVAQQVGEFYYLGNISLAKNLTTVFIKDYLSRQMNFNLTFYNDSNIANPITLYSKINNGVNYKDSQITSSTSRTIFGFINTSNYYGPYTFKVQLWI